MDIVQTSPRKIIIEKVNVDNVLNTNEHVDGGWFWTKYSANPYMGCQYGCTYCFLRENKYGLNANDGKNLEDPFSQFIKVKINAAKVLNKELSHVPKDIIVTGDYQPIESKFKLSRKLLQVCYRHGFPTIIIAKSPLVARDIDIVKKISKKSWACVVFSISSSKSGNYRNFFEPFSSSAEIRFATMKKFAKAGIYTGTALMPILPFITDKEENLESIVRQTKESGGRFVIAGGLVLSDQQAEFFYKSLEKYDKNLVDKYKSLYKNQFAPQDNSWATVGRIIKKLCEKYDLDYRIKRFISDSPLAVNKKAAEELFLKVYEMELNESNEKDIQKYRELAWKIDELKRSITGISNLHA